jgi:serine/threonine protein kinase
MKNFDVNLIKDLKIEKVEKNEKLGKLGEKEYLIKIFDFNKKIRLEYFFEIKTVLSLNHSFIIKPLGYFCDTPNVISIIFENYQKSLFYLIETNKLQMIDKLRICKNLIELLFTLKFNNLLSLDLNLESIKFNQKNVLKLCDFSFSSDAQLIEEKIVTIFDAPEIVLKRYGRISHKSDIWSFGVILFFLFGGLHSVLACQNDGQYNNKDKIREHFLQKNIGLDIAEYINGVYLKGFIGSLLRIDEEDRPDLSQIVINFNLMVNLMGSDTVKIEKKLNY